MLLSISSAFGQGPAKAGSEPPAQPAAGSFAPAGAPPVTAAQPAQTAPPPRAPTGPGSGPSLVNRLGLVIALAAPLALFILWRLDVIRPGSFRRLGRRNPGPWPWWLWILCAFVVLMTQAAFGSLAAAAVGSAGNSLIDQVAAATAGTAAGFVAAAALLWTITTHTPGRPEAHGLDIGCRGRDVLTGLGALALAYPVVQLASLVALVVWQVTTGDRPSEVAHETLQTIQANPGSPLVWMLALVAVVGAPVIEEILFRVFLQTAILRLTGGPWSAILITSSIFALIHLGAGVPVDQARALAPLFVLSVAMGIYYERTRRVVVPIIMHMAFNTANLVLLMLL